MLDRVIEPFPAVTSNKALEKGVNLLKKVVFLDRDGVINQDSSAYIKSWSEVTFIPKSLEAIRNLCRNGFTVIVVTNQSAVGRKLITCEDLDTIHRNLVAAVEAKGGRIADVFICPHLPENGCDCRKPLPGLLLKAQKAYRIDLCTSIMVGDSEKDIECARLAGCGYAVLVKTGNGCKALESLEKKRKPPDHVAENLFDAADWIIKRFS